MINNGSRRNAAMMKFLSVGNGPKIKEATILNAVPNGANKEDYLYAPMPKVMYKLENATDDSPWSELFSYYPDEVEFKAHEFIGLTLGEARQLFHERDVAYLQS